MKRTLADAGSAVPVVCHHELHDSITRISFIFLIKFFEAVAAALHSPAYLQKAAQLHVFERVH